MSIQKDFYKRIEEFKKISRSCPCCNQKNFQLTFSLCIGVKEKNDKWELNKSKKELEFLHTIEVLCSECEISWDETGEDRRRIPIIPPPHRNSFAESCRGTHLTGNGD